MGRIAKKYVNSRVVLPLIIGVCSCLLIGAGVYLFFLTQKTQHEIVQLYEKQTIESNSIARIKKGEIDDKSLSASKLRDDVIFTVKLPDGSISFGKIIDARIIDGITQKNFEAEFLDGTISKVSLTNGSVKNFHLEDGSVTTAKIIDFAITTAKLADFSVTEVKIADGSITSRKIDDGTIQVQDLATDSVTEAKIADGAITTAKLADSSVSTSKIANESITAAKIALGTITSSLVASDGSIVKIINGTNGVSITNNNDGSYSISLDTSCADNEILKWNAAAGEWLCAADLSGAAQGAPLDARYLTTQTDTTLTNEVVISSLGQNISIQGDDTISRTITLGHIGSFTDIVNVAGSFQLQGTTITTTATELNFVSGVTSNIQGQLDTKQQTITWGDGLLYSTPNVSVSVAAIAGAGLEDDGSNNLRVQDNAITSANITDGTITNLDISPTAQIAESKLNLNFPTHAQHTDTGTTSQTFQIESGISGPKLKNNLGVLEVRNSSDSSYANFKAAELQGTSLSVSGDLTFGGLLFSGSSTVQLTNSAGKIQGISSTYFADLSGANLTTLNASNISSGNIDIARFPLGGNWDISSDVSIESTTLAIGSTGGTFAGRVGIGTATPATTLEIAGGAITISEISAPSTPASGKGAIYAKTDNGLYYKDDDGLETRLTGTDPAQFRAGNMVFNWPPVTDQNGQRPEWWEVQNSNVTLTDVTCASQAVPKTVHTRCLKSVTGASGANVYSYQRMNLIDHDFLDTGSSISAGIWVYQTTANTMKLELVGSASGSLGSATTSASNSWALLKVENKTVGGSDTYVDLRFSVNANSATFFASAPMFNIGGIVKPFEPNSTQYVRSPVANIQPNIDPTGTGWTTVTASSSNQSAFMLDIVVQFQASATPNSSHLRPTYSTEAQSLYNAIMRGNSTLSLQTQAHTLCDDTQRFDWSVGSSAATSITIDQIGYWRWTN